MKNLLGQCRPDKVEVASFDPLVALHGMQETNNTVMRGVMDIFRDLAMETDTSIEVAGHTRKPQNGGEEQLSVYDTRGGGAIVDALRAVRMLDPLDDKDLEDTDIDDKERYQYVKISPGKRNYSRMATPAELIKIVSVFIPNGDDVGVVTPWEKPFRDFGAQLEMSMRAEQVFMEVAARLIARGQRLSDRKSRNYAPKIIAAQQEAKKEKLRDGILEAAMWSLIEQGRLRIVEYGGHGKQVHELELAND
jgi:hypothetical protein